MFSSESSQLDISSPFCFLHYLNMIHLRRTACDILGHAVTNRQGLACSADSSLRAFIQLKKKKNKLKEKKHWMLATCGMPIFRSDDQMNSSAACMTITSKEMLIFFPLVSIWYEIETRKTKHTSHCVFTQPHLSAQKPKYIEMWACVIICKHNKKMIPTSAWAHVI